MPTLFYQLSLLFYRLGANILALFNNKAHKFVKGHGSALTDIKKAFQQNNDPIAWFHCASLGEFEQGRPIIEKLKENFPSYKILLTFFSPSGYEVRKNYDKADFVFYLPWDTKSNAQKMVEYVNPSIAIFVKYEFWHFFIKALNLKGIPVLSTSSIFRPDQIYFKSYGKFQLKILKRITHFFVQNEVSKELLKQQGITQITVTGDTRFDRVAEIVNNRQDLEPVANFKGNHSIMVIGSCWNEDLDVLLPFINTSALRFIIAPHEIEGDCIERIINESKRKTIRYSKLDEAAGDEDILIVDNVGLLSSLYGYGEYAFIGGAFKAGLHNILEAATYGVPIFFGNKNYKKFNEAVDLITLGGAMAIGGAEELQNQFDKIADNRQAVGNINKAYVLNNTGATDKIILYCKTILSK